MKKIKLLLKAVSFSLAIILIAQILPLSTIATELNNKIIEEQNWSESVTETMPAVIGEVESLRDEYTKHFRCEDGSFVAAVYSEPVHYSENGEWKEIDNTVEAVSAENAEYSLSKTSMPITFPENMNNGEITITRGDNVISFGAIGGMQSSVSAGFITEPEELFSTSAASLQADESLQPVNEFSAQLAADSDSSAIIYPAVFHNAYIEYEVSASMIKESIVVTEKAESYRYEFSLDFGDYTPIYDELTGGIYIYDAGEAVMAINPPYMFDADGDTSDEVTMELVQSASGYILAVEADADWINRLGRDFPVVIDPTFDLDLGRSGIDDIHVNQNKPDKSYKLDYQLEVGRNNNNVFRTYIKYALPELPDCSIVTNAELSLIQNWYRNIAETDLYLNVYQCEENWNFDSITWSNQPIQNLSEATLVDYTTFKNGMSTEYNLNITKIVKDWYENGNNCGLMLASSNESVEEKTSFFSSRNIVSDYPVVAIQYVNNTGLEDYWAYESFSLGKSGAGYINTYNGALTYVHNDASTNVVTAPISVSHVYNVDDRSASGAFEAMKFGKGFKLNYIEYIEETGSEEYPYKYIDGDGTVHYFKQDGDNCYYEFDSNIRLSCGSSSSTMYFEDGSTKVFDFYKRLASIVDKNDNSIYIRYDDDNRVRYIGRGNARVGFAYDSNGYLSYILDAAQRKIYYSYDSNGYLTEISYPDGTKTVFEYDSVSGFMSKITAFDDSQATLTYKPTGGKYKVASYSTHGNDDAHSVYDTVTFDYRTSDTRITSDKAGELVLAFDGTGKVITSTKDGKTISAAEYLSADLTGANKNGFNKTSFSSAAITYTENMATRRNSTYYHAHSKNTNYIYSASNNERQMNGHSSFKLGVKAGTDPASSYVWKHTLPHVVSKTYTYSVYANVVDTLAAGTAYMKVDVEDSNGNIIETYKREELTTTNNEWKLLSVTVTVPENTAEIKVGYGLFDGVGVVYMSSFYHEEAESPGRRNLLGNSGFNNLTDLLPIHAWDGTYRFITYGTNPVNGSKACYIVGEPNYEKELIQSVTLDGKAGDVLIYGGSAQALASASGNSEGPAGRFFGMTIALYGGTYADRILLQSDYLYFNNDDYDTMQTAVSSITANQDYLYAEIKICYNHEINTAIFDDIFLYREPYGTSYEYNDGGRLVAASDDNGTELTFGYTGSDLTSITEKINGVVTQSVSCAYDNDHNLLSAVGTDGVEVSYTYDNEGLPLSVTVSDASGENTSTTSYTYTESKDYLASVTEPTGAVTEYEYDEARGLVTRVTDPNGNITDYEYDPDSDRLVKVSAPQISGVPETTIEYSSDNRYWQIDNVMNVYFACYDQFGRLEMTATNDITSLIYNTYDSEGNLAYQFIGSYDVVDFTYDDENRVKNVAYNNELNFEYDYTSSGQLGRLTDHDNGVEWSYRYDLAGRPTEVLADDGRSFKYQYNDKNAVGSFKATDGNATLLETQYSYDQYSRASGVEITSMAGSPSQSYNYDTLGRTSSVVNEYSENGAVTQSYTYVTHNGNQTGLVETISYTKNGEAVLPTLRYEYDAKGNITSIYENGTLKAEYHYDELNRLLWECDYVTEDVLFYEYDKYGNMLYKMNIFDSVDIKFEYKSPSSGNAVSKYGDYTMTYDEIGNPISYKGYSMVWTKAKQLASVSGNGIAMSFKYDSNGIRTLKRVNGVDTEFTYAGTTLVSQKTGNEIMNFAYTAGGAPYGFTYNGANYFYLLNLQGDVIGIYDSNGDVVVKYAYDSWGQLMSITGTLADTVGVKNPLRYRGYYYDTETKLYYLQSRYYDPETCHFISMDSYFVAGDYINGMNMYAYCLNNPVMYSDHSGYAVDGSTDNVVEDILNSLFSMIILKSFVNMSDEDIVYLANEIEDSGDLYYVSMVILNGYYQGFLYPLIPLHEGIEGKKRFQVCKAFTNKNVCLKVAEYYTWAFDGEDGAPVIEIAKEIYGHTMLYYNFDTVKPAIDYLINTFEDPNWGTTNSHADPTDLGENPKDYITIFNVIWMLF